MTNLDVYKYHINPEIPWHNRDYLNNKVSNDFKSGVLFYHVYI